MGVPYEIHRLGCMYADDKLEVGSKFVSWKPLRLVCLSAARAAALDSTGASSRSHEITPASSCAFTGRGQEEGKKRLMEEGQER